MSLTGKAGRPQGSGNAKVIWDVLDAHNFNLVEAMVLDAMHCADDELRYKYRVKIWDKLMPNLKAVAHTIDDDFAEKLSEMRSEMEKLTQVHRSEF